MEPNHEQISVSRQCKLLGLNRSSFYRKGAVKQEPPGLEELVIEQYLRTPYYGARRISAWLKRRGIKVGRKKARSLMKQLGLKAISPGPDTSKPSPEHRIYPYLLRGVKVTHKNQVWSTDITYIRLPQGFLYLTAVIDWHSRYVLSWRLSNTLDTGFCIEALEEAFKQGRPEIFNTDQGSQFTSEAFTGVLKKQGIQISMDGRGRATDNAKVERLWRSVKYEEVLLKGYQNVKELKEGLKLYFQHYNEERPHQALGYQTPEEVHFNHPSLKAG